MSQKSFVMQLPQFVPKALTSDTSDGVQIAYASVGAGPPLVKGPNWMNHLEYDWQSPVWRHLMQELAREHKLIRFDQRGNGLSDWDAVDLSFEAFVSDLEAVVDAAGLEKFALLMAIRFLVKRKNANLYLEEDI